MRISFAEGVFLFLAVFGGIIFVIRFIFYFIGFASFEDCTEVAQTDISAASLQGFAILNLHTISVFALMSGIAGYGALSFGFSIWIASVSAILSGSFGVFVIYQIFALARRLQSDGSIRIQSAVGQKAVVYLSIKPKVGGKVQISLKQRLLTRDAYTMDDEVIPTGVLVKIVKIEAGRLIVEPLEKDENTLSIKETGEKVK